MLLEPGWTLVLAVCLAFYMLLMLGIGWWSSAHQGGTSEDFLLAGRSMSASLAALTLLATWFGAGVMLTVSDRVARGGIGEAVMDPLGVTLCLVLAGWWLARPLWEMGIVTLCDFYRRRFGVFAEKLSALILVPSYFGWIATQFVALAEVLHQLFGLEREVGVVLVMLAGTGYTLIGGLRAVVLTDAIQTVIIVVGLVMLVAAVLFDLGWDRVGPVLQASLSGEPDWKELWLAVDLVIVGALGNLPAQDLIQRILCVRSARDAQRACYLAAVGYTVLALIPVGLGLLAGALAPELAERVIMGFAERYLHGALMVIFVLAVVSAVLSTISGAVLSPAGVVAQNLVSARFRERWGALAVNRWSVVAISLASLATAFSGDSAFQMLEDAYSLMLVGLLVPLLGGLWMPRRPPVAAITSMLAGTGVWVVHYFCGWDEWFCQSWLEPQGILLPANLAMTALAGVVFLTVGTNRPATQAAAVTTGS